MHEIVKMFMDALHALRRENASRMADVGWGNYSDHEFSIEIAGKRYRITITEVE